MSNHGDDRRNDDTALLLIQLNGCFPETSSQVMRLEEDADTYTVGGRT